MATPGPTASSISVAQTIDMLSSKFSGVADGVVNGAYVYWLGSGISRDKVPGLDGLVLRVLEFLFTHADPGNADCKFIAALESAVALADLDADENSRVDFVQAPSNWPDIDTIVYRLTGRYASLLDIRVVGQPQDFLLWEAVDVRDAYPTNAAPDVEHYCLAILALEGVLPEVVSANWDGLIESALFDLSPAPADVLRVCVLAPDFRAPRGLTRLLKFHGCAILAAEDPPTYREVLVGRQSQITAWPNDTRFSMMRDQLQTLATMHPTLMVGLSAQDSNIQEVFAGATSDLQWTWPSDPPAHVFSGQALGEQQLNILKVVYRDAYDDHGPEIEEGALVPAYAKPLLTAFVLLTLAEKLCAAIAEVEAPDLPGRATSELADGIRVLRDQAAAEAGGGTEQFVTTFIGDHGRASALFTEGQSPAPGSRLYRPLTTRSPRDIATDPTLATNGVRELAAALGLLGRGAYQADWQVSRGGEGGDSSGSVTVTTGGRRSAVYFVANAQAGIRLMASGNVTPTDRDAVVVYSTDPGPTAVRSPNAQFGRTGRSGPRVVAMSSLLRHAESTESLAAAFRRAGGL